MEKQDELEKIKILIVDDHTLVREGFAKMLELESSFNVVGQASSARDALEKTKSLRPEIVLMDIKLPGINGIEATKMIKKEHPDVEVIILSMYDEEEYVMESVKAGATGYVLKDISQDELFSAIKVVHSGGSLIQPGLARKVLKEFAHMAKEVPAPGKTSPIKELSDREIEVLQCVSEGKSNKEIAEQLTISEKTVKAHLRTIFRKLDVNDRAQAVAEAMRKGLVD
ncbi:MAG: response regulator transcription factor [Candidatus Eremiobacteraeota bacterium]|nr:response regulator transcription factor [Candidatus Eremiobacteraeota bacterium]